MRDPFETYEPVIGLEVHCQLLTQSKIFCGCPTRFGAKPNENTCPVCLGLPGTLPVLNGKVVECAVLLGLALQCNMKDRSVFARKNYFYPDLPKGYQISQYEKPICEGGHLTFDFELENGDRQSRDIRLTRIHMEEDAGKSIHVEGGNHSLLDFNRAGVPLLEIVSEPELRSSLEASAYLKAMRSVVMALGICDGNMQEGSLRCDANVSVRKKGETQFGTRVEIKNLNSFRFVRQAIDLEVLRQVDLIESGGRVVQETRSFDAETGRSATMRSKEDAHDYRYFPDPDLPAVRVDDQLLQRMRSALPELPRARAERFVSALAMPAADARLLNDDQELATYFEQALQEYPANPVLLANWVMQEVLREIKDSSGGIKDFALTPHGLAELVKLLDQGDITGRIGKDLFALMVKERRNDAAALVKEKGWVVLRDQGALESAVDEVLRNHPSEMEKFKAGKVQILGFLVGQVMKKTGGKADPKTVQEIIRRKTD